MSLFGAMNTAISGLSAQSDAFDVLRCRYLPLPA